MMRAPEGRQRAGVLPPLRGWVEIRVSSDRVFPGACAPGYRLPPLRGWSQFLPGSPADSARARNPMSLVPINWRPDRKTLAEFSEFAMFFLGMVAAPLA